MNRRIVILAVLLLGLGASLFMAAQRVRVESANKAVEIALDYDEIGQIAAAIGKSPVKVMKSFKQAGATSVAVEEETLEDALSDGRITALGNGRYSGTMTEINRLYKMIEHDLPHAKLGLRPPLIEASPNTRIEISLPADMSSDYLAQLPMGMPAKALAQVKQAGLIPIARLVNYPGISSEAINSKLKEVKSQGIRTIIFSGDQVLGFKGAIDDTAKAIAANGLYNGRVEFSKQKGDDRLAFKTIANTITVHSIAADEMPKMDRPSIVDRFQKAVRERGVKICYVRMYETASDDILRDNVDYVQSISRAIGKAGYTLKPSHTIGEVQSPRIMRALAGAGVGAGAMLLLLAIFDLSAGALTVLGFGLILACAAMAGAAEIGRKAVALLSAIVFPTLAVINATKSTPDSPTTASGLVPRTIARFLVAVLTVSIGGMLIVGLLSERSFMLRVDQFLGVKLAHLLPVLILAALYAGGIAWRSGAWADQKALLYKKVKEIAVNPILIGQAVVTLAALVIVGLMVVRSGNDSGVGVSALELKFRSILDKVLFVRPRTKEFLIGYPALIAGIAFALKGMRQWAAPLVIVGSIGLISALNTFCHIHTPIELSLLRVVNGAVVGGLIGMIVLHFVCGKKDA
ncbi:MAG: DUF5693 family protein [Armatimonadetes bacterium]|nr:DUF5693 family protein [Armatimonadota bacterium]